METNKNVPPKGVLIAVGVIIGLIIFYLAISALFPDLFQSMSTGDAAPVKPN